MLSLAPTMPKLSNLDPVKGVGQMFGLRGLIELAKGVVRLVAALAVAAGLIALGLEPASSALSCGLDCLEGVTLLMIRSALLALATIAILFAIPDVVLQRTLFLRDMMMSVSERKREKKESFGDPEVRKARNRLRKEQQAGADRTGARHATVLVVGRTEAVAIRYSKPEMPIPVLIVPVEGVERVANLVAAARDHDVPRHYDDRLAGALLRSACNGGRVPADFFEGIARALAAART